MPMIPRGYHLPLQCIGDKDKNKMLSAKELRTRKLMEQKRSQETSFQVYLDKVLAQIEEAARNGMDGGRLLVNADWETMRDPHIQERYRRLCQELAHRGFVVDDAGLGMVSWA